MLIVFLVLIPIFCLAQSGTFFLMGTYARIELPRGYSPYKVYGYLRDLERKLSHYMEDSDISRINASAGVSPVKVSDETLEVLGLSMYAYYKSYGFFKVVFDKRTAKRLGIENLKIRGGEVFLTDGRLALDLGGIGKGYAVQKAYERAGSPWGFIGIAGDMKVWGRRRVLAVKDPIGGGSLVQMVNAKDLCLSTSGNYHRRHIRSEDGGLYQITVVYTDCALADAYATALFAMPPELRRRFLKENPDVGVLELYRDGSLYLNAAFFSYFERVIFLRDKTN